MNKYENVENFLDERVNEALHENRIERLFMFREKILINGLKYEYDCWMEEVEFGQLVVFELRRKNWFLCTRVSTVGLLLDGANRKIIDQESMWELGYG